MGVDAAGQYPAYKKKKKKIAKRPIGKNLDGCNLRRHKLQKRTIQLGTLNVQGIRNKTGEIKKGLEKLKQEPNYVFLILSSHHHTFNYNCILVSKTSPSR